MNCNILCFNKQCICWQKQFCTEISISRSGRFIPRKEPRYPFNRGIGGPHSRSGSLGEQKNQLPLPDTNSGSSSPERSHHIMQVAPANNDEIMAESNISNSNKTVVYYRRMFLYLSFNQQSEYKVFYKLMCWLAGSLTCRLPNVVRSPPARRSRKFNHY